jgi:hypothetical protein
MMLNTTPGYPQPGMVEMSMPGQGGHMSNSILGHMTMMQNAAILESGMTDCIDYFTSTGKYTVSACDLSGAKTSGPVMSMREDPSWCWPCLPVNCRSWTMDITSLMGSPSKIRFDRPFQPTFFCLFRPYIDVYIVDASGERKIGKVVFPCYICPFFGIKYEVYDQNDTFLYSTDGCIYVPTLCRCLEFTLDIKGPAGDVLGGVTRQFGPFINEWFCNGRNFIINFPPGANAEQKALLFAVAMMFDMNFYRKWPCCGPPC